MYKVLIVEDDPMVAMINEQYVGRNPDFTVVGTCRNGQEALDFLIQNEADLVILDVYMPYMDGLETLKKIRELNIPVEAIMVTAATDTSTLEATMHLGGIDYLVKPFAYERFQIALEKYAIKIGALKNASILNQHSIDCIISSDSHSSDKDFPKGIQEKTLLIIMKELENSGTWLDGDSIAKSVGLSSVTVRRYMNFLVESNRVVEDVNYGTGGRPSMMYKIK